MSRRTTAARHCAGSCCERLLQRPLELVVERLRFGTEIGRSRQRLEWIVAILIGFDTRRPAA